MPRRTTHIAPACPTATNACGRILRVDDGTGYQIFAYDRLGNVTENTRAIALPFEDSVYNFRMLFEYDSWNRVQRIVYPDSEVVTYNYDLGGQLYSVSAFKNNVSSSLINSILYDEFGHRTQVNFGNGVTTNYNYDILQRLSTLQTYSNNANLQKIMYSFDYEDNITKVINTAGGANGLGGAYTFDYQYDNLYRLTSSTGSFTPTNASYFLEMDFTPAGRVCRKEQGDPNATRRLLYSYNPHNAPHAARRIYDPSTTNLRQMLWDANGNLAQIAEYNYDPATEITTLQDFRNHYWDEDDRLNLVLDNSHFSYYLYGYDGQRVAKLTGSAFTLGTGFATNAMLDNYTLYPSEYLVVTQQGYTKYYYAGGTRIASKLGSGGFEKMQRLCTHDQNLTANANSLFSSVVANIGNAMSDYHISDPCPNYYSDIAGFRVPLPTLNFDPNFGITAQQNILQAFRQNYANEETYYFHGNHLGSANWVTLQNASPTQFLSHLPYGEEFVKQLNSTYDERFTFTGKEKDIETGYYYFGARFDNVDLGFMSVDPMADKYPSLTPYNYCAWNPVKIIDPDGCDTLVFNKYGNYSHPIKSDGEHVGRYEQPSGKPYTFTFADPINDPIAIKEGKITKLQIVKEDDIKTMLRDAGVFSDDNRKRKYGYAKEEGIGLGKLDFSKKAKGGMASLYGTDTYKSMYLIDGVAHNPENFGNFLFGAAGNALGIPLIALKLGAHWNSVVNSEENGYNSQLDSKDDQFSIKCGFNYAQRHKYNAIKK